MSLGIGVEFERERLRYGEEKREGGRRRKKTEKREIERK
jgi:hypothetical protein